MKIAAIYYLHREGRVFYIGQTTNPYIRLNEHKRYFGPLTKMIILEWCDYDLRLKKERYFIKQYKDLGFALVNFIPAYCAEEYKKLISVKIDEDVHTDMKVFAAQTKVKNLTQFVNDAVRAYIRKLKK